MTESVISDFWQYGCYPNDSRYLAQLIANRKHGDFPYRVPSYLYDIPSDSGRTAKGSRNRWLSTRNSLFINDGYRLQGQISTKDYDEDDDTELVFRYGYVAIKEFPVWRCDCPKQYDGNPIDRKWRSDNMDYSWDGACRGQYAYKYTYKKPICPKCKSYTKVTKLRRTQRVPKFHELRTFRLKNQYRNKGSMNRALTRCPNWVKAGLSHLYLNNRDNKWWNQEYGGSGGLEFFNANQEHECVQCNGVILNGDTYLTTKRYYDVRRKYHLECYNPDTAAVHQALSSVATATVDDYDRVNKMIRLHNSLPGQGDKIKLAKI